MEDDKRWMIRGVDKALRKAIKDAAKAEGVSIGSWVRRALERALAGEKSGAETVNINDRVLALEKRVAEFEQAQALRPGRAQAGSSEIRKRRRRSTGVK